MADISTLLEQILKARYGKDVRQNIHDAIKQCYDDMDEYSDFPEYYEGNLKNILESVVPILNASNVSRKELSGEETNGALIINSGLVVSKAEYLNKYYVYKYDVSEYVGKVVFIDARSNYDNCIYSICDSNNTVLQKLQESVRVSTDATTKRRYPIYIPEGSKWLYISRALSFSASAYTIETINTEPGYSDFYSTIADKKAVEVSLNILSARTLDIYGNVYGGNPNPISDTYKVSDMFLVKDTDKIRVTCSATYKNAGGVFLNKDFKPVSIILQGDGSTSPKEMINTDVDVPSDAMYCILASATSNVLKAYEYIPNYEGDSTTYRAFSPDKIYTSKLISGTGELTDLDTPRLAYEVHEFKTSNIPNEVYITAGANYYNTYYAFYTLEGELVSKSEHADGSPNGGSITNRLVSIPEGAELLRVCNNPFGQQLPYVSDVPIIFQGKWKEKKWVVFGDSLTELNYRSLKPYHYYIKEKTGINVTNYGLSGSGYKRKDDSNNAFYQRISNLSEDFDVITIFGSGNDLGAGVELGNSSDTGTDTLCGAINTTIDNLFKKHPLANLGIVTPTPWDGYKPGNDNLMEKYSNAIVEICKNRGIPCLDLYHCSGLRPWEAAYKELAYSKDEGSGTHPDETGHALIAPRFEAFLDSLLLH